MKSKLELNQCQEAVEGLGGGPGGVLGGGLEVGGEGILQHELEQHIYFFNCST